MQKSGAGGRVVINRATPSSLFLHGIILHCPALRYIAAAPFVSRDILHVARDKVSENSFYFAKSQLVVVALSSLSPGGGTKGETEVEIVSKSWP